MGSNHQHTAELVEEHKQLGAPCVLVVHDFLQMVAASEVVKEPGGESGMSLAQGHPQRPLTNSLWWGSALSRAGGGGLAAHLTSKQWDTQAS
jgi:hypothetical protein